MQKVIIEGIPFWKDKSSTLYSFEPEKKNLLTLGSYKDNKYLLKEDWQAIYKDTLYDFRVNLKNRDRKENKLDGKK